MGSTTIFTTVVTTSRKYFALPHTVSVQKRKGSGRLFLESTHTLFYQEWQKQLKAIFELLKKLFSLNDWDFFVSIDCEAVEGSSASIPLFLLFASSITGEKLPKNILSTGSMSSPHGFLSYGHPQSLMAKIKAMEHVASYSSIKDFQLLIPFPFYEYTSKTVQCIQVASVFSALKIALPETFQMCKREIHQMVTVTSVLSGSVLDVIPSTGNVFVIHSFDADADAVYTVTNCGGTRVVEEGSLCEPVYFHVISNNKVVLTHQFIHKTVAEEKVFQYKKMLGMLSPI